MKIGQLVLIKCENYPPSHWVIGRVCDKNDKLVRFVGVQTQTNFLFLPLEKIVIVALDISKAEQDGAVLFIFIKILLFSEMQKINSLFIF